MTRESMIKVLRYKSEHIKTRIKPEFFSEVAEALQQQPCEDAVSRQKLKEQMIKYGFHAPDMTITEFVEDLPSVLPYNTSEWCKTCKEYDHDKHCCPRYNKVIRNAVEEMKQESCEDCISRQQAIKQCGFGMTSLLIADNLRKLPPVQPKYNTSEWCKTCKEYDQDKHCCPRYNKVIRVAVEEIKESKTGHCKDCKWWKDSDGLYRRGGHAESQCPINRREVFEGNGYCYMFEPQESEET